MTANSNASPVAFAILFRNKNKSMWRQFWKYCLDLHPCIDSGDITIITNQDKGQKKGFLSIFDWWGTFTVRFIVARILSRCVEEVVGKFPTQRFGCIISHQKLTAR
jgi:hypothetical protein